MPRRIVLHGIADRLRVFDQRIAVGTSFWNEHAYHEIAVCTAGSGVYKSRRGRLRFRKGDIVICNHYEPHAWTAESAGVRYIQLPRPLAADIAPVFGDKALYLDAFVRGTRGGFLMHHASPPVYVQVMRVSDALARECSQARAAAADTRYSDALIRAYCIELIAVIGRDIDGSDSKPIAPIPDHIERSLHHIQRSIAQELTLASAAEAAGLSEDHFSKVFRRTTGCYFTEYVNEMRVREACRLLGATVRSITDIAFAVGYRNVPYFNRIFKAATGCTPAAYRRRIIMRGKREEKAGKG